MKNITKVILGAILIISISAPFLIEKSRADGQIINMKAMMNGLNNARIVDENNINKSLDVHYLITVSGSPTYTYIQREVFDVTLNLSKLNKINDTIVSAIKQHSIDAFGYEISGNKIIYIPFEKP